MAKIPDGYMQDAKGRLVPVEMVAPIDQARDQLVREIVAGAQRQAAFMAAFKQRTFDDIQAFVELSAERYGVKMGGIKGNVTLMSFDGRYKLVRAIADFMVFDERLQVAKQLIDGCIHEWSQGARAEIKALVNDAFQVDKAGRVNTTRILGLRRLEINDPQWQQAMKAIGDSLTVAATRAYVRVYERVGDTDEYRHINLDLAGA
jgi:hypothetical protein